MENKYTRKFIGSEIDTALSRVAFHGYSWMRSDRIFTVVNPVSSHAGKNERKTSPATGLPVKILLDSEQQWEIGLLYNSLR